MSKCKILIEPVCCWQNWIGSTYTGGSILYDLKDAFFPFGGPVGSGLQSTQTGQPI